MKNVKKLLSIVMVLTLVLSLGASVFAAEGTDGAKVDIDSKLAGHTFTAYAIFTGTQAADQDNELASIKWGDGIDASAFVTALKGIDSVRFAECTAEDPQSVAEALEGADADLAKKVAEAAADCIVEGKGVEFSDSTVLPKGYYLIVDTTDGLEGNAAYNDVVLQVTEDITIAYKTDIPTSEKKVQDDGETEWQDSADWDIGDDVPFQLTGTLPSNYDDYESYAITFHDEQSAGLTFDPESVEVYVDGTKLTTGYEVKVASEEVVLADDCTFEIVIANLKEAAPSATAASKIVVTYKSELNDKAVIGPGGNPNTLTMDFSNNPHGEGTGTTPEDKVIVFTYEFDVNKEDESGDPLEGAGFTLYKKVYGEGMSLDGHEGSYEVVGDGEITGVTTFEFKGLDDGDYVLVETTVPAGFNKAADIEFKIEATHEKEATTPKLLTFKATGDEDSKITVDESETSVTGKFSTDVVNKTGATLPETGGIGTTIFYIVGAVLVAGAVILLVTKKRVSGAEK